MGDDIGRALLLIFGSVITLAIVSVLVGQKSTAPAAIGAASDALAKVVSAAVSPAASASTNGNLGANVFSTPSFANLASSAGL